MAAWITPLWPADGKVRWAQPRGLVTLNCATMLGERLADPLRLVPIKGTHQPLPPDVITLSVHIVPPFPEGFPPQKATFSIKKTVLEVPSGISAGILVPPVDDHVFTVVVPYVVVIVPKTWPLAA